MKISAVPSPERAPTSVEYFDSSDQSFRCIAPCQTCAVNLYDSACQEAGELVTLRLLEILVIDLGPPDDEQADRLIEDHFSLRPISWRQSLHRAIEELMFMETGEGKSRRLLLWLLMDVDSIAQTASLRELQEIAVLLSDAQRSLTLRDGRLWEDVNDEIMRLEKQANEKWQVAAPVSKVR